MNQMLKMMYMAISKIDAGNFEQEKVRNRNKAIYIFRILNAKNDLIDINELRRAAFTGIPSIFDEPGQGGDLRSIIWMILLGVLPLQPS